MVARTVGSGVEPAAHAYRLTTLTSHIARIPPGSFLLD